MSYILDALTKSQQQRRQAEVPGLETPQVAPAPRRGGPATLWNATLLAVAVAGVGYGIHAHLSAPNAPRDSTPAPDASVLVPEVTPADSAGNVHSSGSSDARESSVTEPRAEAAKGSDSHDVAPREARAAPAPWEASAVQASPTVSSGHDTGARRETPTGQRAARPSATRTPPAPRPLPRAASSTQEPPGLSRKSSDDPSFPALPEPPRARASPETERLRQDLARLAEEERSARAPSAMPMPTPQPVPEAAPAVPPLASASAPLTLNELPSDVRLGLGDLKVNAHVYSGVPAERLIVINMRRYREGERLTAGPRIDAITPRGAVLSLDSRRFRIDVR